MSRTNDSAAVTPARLLRGDRVSNAANRCRVCACELLRGRLMCANCSQRARRDGRAIGLAVARRVEYTLMPRVGYKVVPAAGADVETAILASLRALHEARRDQGPNARYENGWYYCWLIERRDRPQPEWFGADCLWHTDASKAMWFARKEDAEASAGDFPHDAIVCEHGFQMEKLP